MSGHVAMETSVRGDAQWGTLPRLAQYAARRFGDRTALVDTDRDGERLEMSYVELVDQSRAAAKAWMASGVQHGDRVAVWAPNIWEWIGRAWYAFGFDSEVARLVGLRVKTLQIVAFLISAALSGLAGIIVSARINSGSYEAGPPYLLSAFAAVFLGATQFRRGRFNAWGAVVAVFLLGTGQVGLSLAGAPTWVPNVFAGVILIAAMALTQAEQS